MSIAYDINHSVDYTAAKQSGKTKKQWEKKTKRKQDGRLRANSFCRSLPMAKNSQVSSNNTNAHGSKPQTTPARSYLNATCWQEVTSPVEDTPLKKWQPLSLFLWVFSKRGWERREHPEARREAGKFRLSQLLCSDHYLCEANKQQISSRLKIPLLSAWQVTAGINGHIQYMACMYYTVPW